MRDLIQINQTVIGADEVNSVNARELHRILESKQQYSDWIKKRLERFIEGIDYVRVVIDRFHNPMIVKKGLSLQGKQVDYILTLDTAKMIAMLENNTKGDEVRRYFIKVEKQYKANLPKLPQTYKEALIALVEEIEKNEQLELENKKMKPKADYFDGLVDRNLLTNFRDTAKELKVKQKEFINWLIENKYVYRDSKNQLRPYADHTPDLFEIKEWKRDSKVGVQTLITPKGRETFKLLMKI
jgi:anti-repressor protein